jgi:hypothetical protein
MATNNDSQAELAAKIAENRSSPTGIAANTFSVNQDPQPPNSDQGVTNNANSQSSTSGGVDNQSITPNNNYSSNNNQNEPFSSYMPETGKPDPRDSQYWRDVIRLNFDRNTQENNLRLQSVYAQTDFEKANSDLGRQQIRDRLATKIASSKSGNLFSSVSQENLGQLEQGYFNQRSDLQQTYQREEASRQAIRDALAQGYTIDEAAALAAAIDRKAQAELDQPSPYQTPTTNTNTADTGPNWDTLLNQALKNLFPKPKPNKGKGKGKGKGKK